MSNSAEDNFIVTQEYRKFAEFCDACRRYRYIGLCYGPPGVGKTLSARHYSRWDKVEAYQSFKTSAALLEEVLGCDTVFYTPNVLNGPSRIAQEIARLRLRLLAIARGALYHEEESARACARQRHEEYWDTFVFTTDWLSEPPQSRREEPSPSLYEIAQEYGAKRDAITDPTQLILVDEAERLKMASLEQMRAVFDQGDIGLVLIGMPGLEKRLARYPQLYSRIGFVHEFRTLSAEEVRQLLLQSWTPPKTVLPEQSLTDEEALAAIIRITGGNFRLLHRLLTQIARLMEINAMQTVTRQVVEAARESLVIGIT